MSLDIKRGSKCPISKGKPNSQSWLRRLNPRPRSVAAEFLQYVGGRNPYPLISKSTKTDILVCCPGADLSADPSPSSTIAAIAVKGGGQVCHVFEIVRRLPKQLVAPEIFEVVAPTVRQPGRRVK